MLITSNRTGISTMQDVIFALIVRETKTRFGLRRLGLVWVFLEPLMHAIPVYMIRYYTSTNVEEAYILLLTGLIPVLFINKAISQASEAISSNINMFSFGVVKPFDVIFSRVVLEFILFIASISFFSLIYYFMFGKIVVVESYLFLLFLLFLLFAFALFIGIVIGMFARVYNFISPALGYFSRVIYFSSGVFFMLQELPESLKKYLLYSPITQMIDLIRGLIALDYIPHDTNVWYILCCLLAIASIACITYMSLKEKVLISQ